jgi:acyl-CoA reductase-like NAD-dependent aldehyde dehydrogenase
LLSPLVGAIAAGNNALLKPSEISAATGKVFLELVPKYLDPKCFVTRVTEPKETGEILA